MLFSRFDRDSKFVVAFSKQMAQECGQETIGTGHLLLSLARAATDIEESRQAGQKFPPPGASLEGLVTAMVKLGADPIALTRILSTLPLESPPEEGDFSLELTGFFRRIDKEMPGNISVLDLAGSLLSEPDCQVASILKALSISTDEGASALAAIPT